MNKMMLHICCGPCAIYVVDLLSKDYEVVAYFFNPNIFPYEEWVRRYKTFLKVIKLGKNNIDYFPKKVLSKEEWEKEHKKFLEKIKDLEKEREGGKRCAICYKIRLGEAGKMAKELKIENFATTLTIGRNKKAETINKIGKDVADKYKINFYDADFKKKDGFLKSVKMSKKINLYRQNYCGCEFSIYK